LTGSIVLGAQQTCSGGHGALKAVFVGALLSRVQVYALGRVRGSAKSGSSAHCAALRQRVADKFAATVSEPLT
jgi:hypothetical protein